MAILVRTNTDANNFLDAAGIARTEANGSIILGIHQLTTDLKQYGLWDKMKVIYPMVGQAGVSSSFQYNLKDPNTFRGTFSGSWTFSTTGAKPNGISGNGTGGTANGYFDTKLNWYTHTDLNNVAFGAYWTDWPDPVNNAQYYGVYSSATTIALIRGLNGTSDNYINDTGVGQVFSAGNGLHAMSRVNSTEITHYLNTTVNTRAANSTGKANLNFWFGGTNGTPVSFNSFQSYNLAFAFISEGLNTTEWTSFYTAVQRFQTTLGRQV